MAAAYVIAGNDKKTVGIDRFAGANIGIPPTWLVIVFAVPPSGMVMA